MQNSGTLTEQPLDAILETVQKDRATGTLQISSGDRQASLYFLFGHLFHAIDGDRVGEAVVYDALEWSEGDFTFDSKSKLPAEETIKVSTADLVAAHAGTILVPPPAPEPALEPAEVEAAQALAAAVSEEPSSPEPETPAPSGAPRRRRTDMRPGTRPPETMELYPVPLGKLIYESLTAGFVDFPKLLKSLAKDKHSGYVRLSGDGFSAVLLFSSGAVVEAIYDANGQVSTGPSAFKQFGAHIDEGEGSLDVIQLTPEMVTGIFQLLTGPSIYEKLVARFVHPEALLEYLGEQGASGAVIIRHENSCGIVLFREGQMLGSYTDKSRDVSDNPAKVVAICKEPMAEIEVRGGPVPAALPVMESTGAKGGPTEVPSGSPPGAQSQDGNPARSGKTAATAVAEESLEPVTSEVAVVADIDGAAAPSQDVDWAPLIEEMAGRADSVLGTRAKKVKELLYATNHSRQDVEATIDKISELSIMFVDPSKLTALAEDMRRIAAGAE